MGRGETTALLRRGCLQFGVEGVEGGQCLGGASSTAQGEVVRCQGSAFEQQVG